MGSLRSRLRSLAGVRERVREAGWRILQTTAAAVGAWYAAVLLLSVQRPFFAPVAAIIALGASFGERWSRTLEVIAGVVIGAAVAELLIAALGVGPLQLGLLVILSMLAAVVLRGGPILVNQAAISALLLAVLEAGSGTAAAADRVLEALVGGGVALAANSLLFPPNPLAMVDRAIESLVADLADALERTAGALASGDRDEASRALRAARGLDDLIDSLDDALDVGRETARFAPPRRTALGRLDQYEQEVRQLDFAVRNTRVLARDSFRYVRRHGAASEDLSEAVRELGAAVRTLGGDEDQRERAAAMQRLAYEAARRAGQALQERSDLVTSSIVNQVRSTAVDLVRAAEWEEGASDRPPSMTTEEVLPEPGERAP